MSYLKKGKEWNMRHLKELLSSKKGLEEDIKHCIENEHRLEKLYRYISNMIRNGLVRKTFKNIAEEEAGNQDALGKRYEKLTGHFCLNKSSNENATEEKPEDFSLLGAIEVAEKIECDSMVTYKDTREEDTPEYKDTYDSIITHVKTNLKVLKKEKRFVVKIRNNPLVDNLFRLLYK